MSMNTSFEQIQAQQMQYIMQQQAQLSVQKPQNLEAMRSGSEVAEINKSKAVYAAGIDPTVKTSRINRLENISKRFAASGEKRGLPIAQEPKTQGVAGFEGAAKKVEGIGVKPKEFKPSFESQSGLAGFKIDQEKMSKLDGQYNKIGQSVNIFAGETPLKFNPVGVSNMNIMPKNSTKCFLA